MARTKQRVSTEEATVMVGCRLPISEAKRLRAYAQRAGLTFSDYLRLITRRGLAVVSLEKSKAEAEAVQDEN